VRSAGVAITALLAGFVIPAGAQAPGISGTVLNSRSLQPVPGVQVTVVGTNLAATSGADGRFRIQGELRGEVTLRAAAIGYRPLTQSARAGDTDLRLLLVEMAVNLEEIVVTGTPGEERRAVGNAVSKIAAEDLVEVAPVADLAQLLNGRAAGALVRTGSGAIGSGSRITLRGSATLGLNDQPLIYVDGVRVDNKVGVGLANEGAGTPNGAVGRLNDYSPEDIESIEIIKGPAAATLYGTEAANGVVQIVTKRGRRGEGVAWDLVVRQGATWFQNPAGRFGKVYGLDASSQVVEIDPYQLALSQGEDHFRTGHLQGYALSASGGTGIASYYLAAEFDQDDGTDITQTLTDYRTRLNLGLTPSERLRIDASLTYLRGHTQTPNDGNFGGPIWAYVNVRPSLLTTPRRGWLFGSPVEWDRGWKFMDDVRRFTGSLQVSHRPTDWLTHRLTVGADLLSDDFNSITEKMPPDLELAFGAGLARGGRSYEARDATNTTVDYGASASVGLTRVIRSTTSAGLQYYHKGQRTISATGSIFPAAGITAISAAAIRNSAEAFFENNTVGLYLQEQIGLNDRVFLTGALRADDNSAFGANFDVATYPKASLTWVITEEPFWRLGAVNTLKLRGAFGASGQQPDVFAALRTFDPVTGGGGTSAVRPAQIGNPDLKPERSEELELGFDASLFDERLAIEFTYYNKKTTDAIVARQLAPSGGFPGSQFVNLGEISSKGIELLATARILDSRAVDVDLTINLATNDNVVGRTGSPSGFLSLGGGQRHADGFPIAAFFSQKVVSATLNSTTKRAENILCDGGTGKLGLEQGGAPVACGTAPLVYVGDAAPTFFGSISPTVTVLDRLQLFALFDFQRGFDRVDWVRTGRCGAGTCAEAFFPERFDIIKVAEQQLRYFTAYGIDDASFVKLREVSARYAFPERWTRLLGAKRATITVSGRHLHTWTGYSGLDPETIRLSQAFNASQFAITPPAASVLTRIDVSF
jgi:TonB-dependent SusC/RagA subfamily outer membrane receptor